MKKRILSFVLALVMICTILPSVAFFTSAEKSEYAPYAQIAYSYTENVECGTIRYIHQLVGGPYYSNKYWQDWEDKWIGNTHYQSKTECGTASISMALSYIGINKTPKDILDAGAGQTYFGGINGNWGLATAKSYTYDKIETAVNNYINGNGKYSPPIIHLYAYSGNHHVVIIGKIGNNQYQVLDPATTKLWTITINGATATYNHPSTGNEVRDSINWLSYTGEERYDDIYQYYNPNASICSHKNRNNVGWCPDCKTDFNWEATFDPGCAGIYKVTLDGGIYLRTDKPSSASTAKSKLIKEGTEVEVLGSVLNAVGTEHHLWYKVSYNGIIGYTSIDNVTWSRPSYADSIPQATCDEIVGQEGGVKIRGWAFDPDTPSESVAIHVYIDNELAGTCTANLSRPDVDNVFHCGEYHGFSAIIPYSVSKTGTHSVAVYAVNTAYGKDARGMGPYNVTISAHTHNYVGEVTANAYCGGTGTMTYTCSGCSASYTETIPATGDHSWGAWGVSTAATCTTNGVKTRKCYVCAGSETQTISATGHSYGSWVTTQTAGCTSNGTKKQTCSNCGDVKTQTISATGHNYTSENIPANCKEPEKTQYTCQNCGDSYAEYVAQEYSDWSTAKPTNVAEDLIEEKKQYRYRSITHTTEYSSWGSWSAWQDSSVSETTLRDIETRTMYPYYYYYCKKCGDGTRWYSYGGNCGVCGTRMESSSGTVVWLTTPWSEATPYNPYGTNTGKYAIHIDGLAYWKWTDGAPKTQYRYRTRTSWDEVSYGSWSSWGDTAYTETSNRDVETRTVYRYMKVTAGNHTWTDGITTSPSTCKEAGKKVYGCTSCGYMKAETLPALGHDYVNGKCIRCYKEDPNKPVKPKVPGDIDGNDKVSSDDVVALLLYISMPDIFSLPEGVNADFTADGTVTTDDAVRLLLHISMPDMFPL